MNVLLSNDDGIFSSGIRALYRAFAEAGHSVKAVAPMRQQSGVGHSLTMFEPLRSQNIEEDDFAGVGVYGTPTDCVKLALGKLVTETPDLVVSGINIGSNVGPDIFYSGTVGAAAEAAHAGIPSIAVSHGDYSGKSDLLPNARHLVRVAEKIVWASIPKGRVLNINYPNVPLEQTSGLRICPQSAASWRNIFDSRTDPRGDPYWWYVGDVPESSIIAGCDKALLAEKFITLTPLSFEFTDHISLPNLEKQLCNGNMG